MFRRSYDIEYSPDHKKLYLTDVLMSLADFPYCIRPNHRPYDRFKDQTVKTLHYVVRYNPMEQFMEEIEGVRRMLIKQWYFLQENPTSEKSVEEADHFHAIKVLSYPR